MSDDVLSEVIRRTVEVAQPQRIILFGSRGRDAGCPDSDVDLLVVKATPHRRKLAMAIYRQLIGVGCAVDIVVVTPEDIKRHGHVPHLIIEPALREGKVVYDAGTPVA